MKVYTGNHTLNIVAKSRNLAGVGLLVKGAFEEYNRKNESYVKLIIWK